MILLQIVRFYLGCLRGRSSPPPNSQLPLPPPKKLLSLQYISNYIGKIIQTRRGQCAHCNISQNWVSKYTRLHLNASWLISKNFQGNMPPDLPRKLVAFGHSGLLLPNDKSEIEPCQWVPVQKTTRSKLKMLGPLCNQTGNLKSDSKTL